MIKNYYYFIVGILCVLFALTHAWNGQTLVLLVFDTVPIDLNTKTVFHYVWHIITAENLIFGTALLFMAFYKDLTKGRLVAWLIAIIMMGRWIVILSFTLFYTESTISQIIPDSLAILVVIGLLILGTRVKSKDTHVE